MLRLTLEIEVYILKANLSQTIAQQPMVKVGLNLVYYYVVTEALNNYWNSRGIYLGCLFWRRISNTSVVQRCYIERSKQRTISLSWTRFMTFNGLN